MVSLLHAEQNALEEFNESKGAKFDELNALVAACADHIFSLKLKQLPSHFDLGEVRNAGRAHTPNQGCSASILQLARAHRSLCGYPT